MEQFICIGMENKFSKYTKIERGIRQACVISPNLFNNHSEMILRELEVLPGFIINGYNLNKRCTDDTDLIADAKRKLQELLAKVLKESKKKALNITCKQAEYIVVSKGNSTKCNYKLEIPKSSKYEHLNIWEVS